jgi:hypothetical protein
MKEFLPVLVPTLHVDYKFLQFLFFKVFVFIVTAVN